MTLNPNSPTSCSLQPNPPPAKQMKKGKEKLIIENELNNFDYKSSPAWDAIKKQFSSGIRHSELLSIAFIVRHLTNVPEVNRSCKRNFTCLIKWFSDNWENISKVIGRIVLLDEYSQPISGQRELIDFCRP